MALRDRRRATGQVTSGAEPEAQRQAPLPSHEALTDVQGGAVGEAYHLTAAEYAALGSGGGATYGSSEIDFGAHPGSTNVSLVVAAPAITSSMRVMATIAARATADHSIDEHVIEHLDVRGGSVVDGVGFTLYASTRTQRIKGRWSVDWSFA